MRIQSRNQGPMLADPAYQVVGHTNVKHTAMFVGHNVNPEIVVSCHSDNLSRWTDSGPDISDLSAIKLEIPRLSLGMTRGRKRGASYSGAGALRARRRISSFFPLRLLCRASVETSLISSEIAGLAYLLGIPGGTLRVRDFPRDDTVTMRYYHRYL